MSRRAFVKPLVATALVLAASWGCKNSSTGDNGSAVMAGSGTAAWEGIPFDAKFDLSKKGSGVTYLEFMQKSVKPAMDDLATNGYLVGDAAAMKAAYAAVHPKVRKKVDALWGGLEKVQQIADTLNKQKIKYTLATLPKAIIAADHTVKDAYGMATFIGLASGGGVAIKYAQNNIAYNVHYDVTEQRSGRSFGTGPERGANDASDKNYLEDLQAYGKSDVNETVKFYRSALKTLLSTDSSEHKNVSPAGQALLTDFLAVYTAEQERNLMDGRVDLHWDAALLEVTLLGEFHSGQKTFAFYYADPMTGRSSFVSQVYPQASCEKPTGAKKQAQMSDYWQFSKNLTNPENCKRSGINITKNEFRLLGSSITKYVLKHNKAVYQAVADAVSDSRSLNLYESLSKFMINPKAPAKFDAATVEKITHAWTDLLALTRNDADKITAEIMKGPSGGVDTSGENQPQLETADWGNRAYDAIYAEDAALQSLGL